ncbi:bifunctional 2-C-methyl-D-erythritol 4-phosphate cytidylyltransferase/2-C-methyl-D-erythritol 2,4-cyclodiphosphate synthase [Erythrobacter sp. AP23]|uniref:bifunctional 2-C-methyl-D-erythritol 4-phosphate cytidylyltransferase/2-C-methyl-D-erythritol 2,4-cyclodiphosphate synthase n=1 Tax=Erythrobacter sp. AP23 TaxID=499656 RepID=UPI00076D1E6E|nr:bifunctional 2-C-methyl-D-erythritol 4-phosphate cytidylyltransferase/2-C-methyl-D-erythritol 2,4-cyclodiphosphate synthase [Erythrobacter sp. AP23]KWV96041.1 2-C-methyl-D-erythritol 2,4-cyclodiphosphate synthase [Erythrobacter sp. AP23]
MQDTSPLPSFAAIVVAAGQGLRAGQPLPKQFAPWRGKPVVRHSVETLLAAGASPLVVAIPENSEEAAQQALAGLDGYDLVIGGTTRQQSVARALEAVGMAERVLIHDAARPDLPREVIARLLAALSDHSGAIPVLPVVDSLSIDTDGVMTGSAERESLRRVQTPQAFRFDDIFAAHAAWQGDADAGDDAQVLRAAGGAVVHVPGDERLAKLTYAEDFMTELPAVRTGTGFDVHRLTEGEELWLGGVRIEHDRGLAGHSDADVALHAIVDALLGSIADGDIGSHFPPSEPQWKGASSDRFVRHAASLVRDAGYRVGNIDLTIICEAPKIGPHRDAMRKRIAELLAVDIGAISVKATTTERLGFTGRGEGIAAQAIATVLSN